MSFDQVLTHVRSTAAKQLGHPLEQITPDSSFLELGADSLIMVDLARGLEETYGVKVTMRELFEDGATPAALAKLVADRMPAVSPTAPETTAPVAAASPTPAVAEAPATVPAPPPTPPQMAPSMTVAPPPMAVAPTVPTAPPVPWIPAAPYATDPAQSARTIEALTVQVQQLLSINQQLTYQLSQLTAMLLAERSGGGQA